MRVQIGNQMIDIKFPGNLFKTVALVVALLVIFYGVLNSYYTVQQDEQAVVTRFGAFQKLSNPGLHFRIPFIDKYEKLRVQQQQNMQFGFSTDFTPKNRFARNLPNSDSFDDEKQMVTGDLNSAQVEWVIQYRISDPVNYLFKVRNPDETLRAASESVMREVVGDRTVDEVITIGRQEMEIECKEKLSSLVDYYELGISVDQVQLSNVLPPQEVKASFNEVNSAQQEKQRDINVAHREYNSRVPVARGEAEKTIRSAEGYATKRTNEADGNVAKFVALFDEFQKSPDVTRRRIYLETMEKVMPQLGKKVIIDENVNQVLPLLPLEGIGLEKK